MAEKQARVDAAIKEAQGKENQSNVDNSDVESVEQEISEDKEDVALIRKKRKLI